MQGESIVQNKVELFEEQGDCYRSDEPIIYKAMSASLSEVENKGCVLKNERLFEALAGTRIVSRSQYGIRELYLENMFI